MDEFPTDWSLPKATGLTGYERPGYGAEQMGSSPVYEPGRQPITGTPVVQPQAAAA